MRPRYQVMQHATGHDEISSLAAQAAAGDPKAFRRLVDRTHKTVYRLAFRLLGDPAGAQDVVQETYLRVWQGLGTLRDTQAALGWICRIARNVARDKQRRQYRRPADSLDTPRGEDREPLRDRLAHPELDPEGQLGSAELSRLVRRAMEGLKEKHRVVLSLREMDGMSYEEIATALGCRIGTVESRLHRARAALTKSLRALARELDMELPVNGDAASNRGEGGREGIHPSLMDAEARAERGAERAHGDAHVTDDRQRPAERTGGQDDGDVPSLSPSSGSSTKEDVP